MAGLEGKVLGGFRILEQVQDEESAQGTVCRAVCETEHPAVAVPKGKVVALKVMPVRDDDRRDQWKTLERRTRELAQLNHPNVVRYYGCFCEQGDWTQLHVIVQEFLEGETLKERLKRFPNGLDVDEGLEVIRFAIAGLSHTVSKGIVHRDIKPGNIFLCEDDGGGEKISSVKLIDFEIAKQGSGSTTASTGNMRGSFNYMAPEFLDSRFRGDLQSDIFSMGVTLHEALTGKLPYDLIDGNGENAILDFVARWKGLSEGKNPVLISRDVNRLLAHAEAMLVGSLAPLREKRFKNIAEFQEAVNAVRFRMLTNPESGAAYQILQFVGKGGFGEVFKVRETKTKQFFAIKHLRKAKYVDRFRREGNILSMFDDDCFVRFAESFSREIDGRAQEFLVMQFLDGMPGNSLWDAIKRSGGQGLPIRDVFVAFVRYAHGLKMLHDAGIFHRDIKPSNLYFPAGKPECAAIMDLGIAKDSNGTTTFGSIPGTPDYMPPEVVLAGNRGASGMDVYALGLCLYEALTAKTAFARLPPDIEGFKKLVERANSKVQPRFDDKRIDADVFDLLTDMTAFNPAYRIKDVEDVERRLREFLVKLGMPYAVPETKARRQMTPLPAPKPIAESEKNSRSFDALTDPTVAGVVKVSGKILLKKCLVWGALPITVCAVLACAVAWLSPWLKMAYAERQLAAVLDAYRAHSPEAANVESAWIVGFSPESYSWLRLDADSFVKCTNAMDVVKRQVRVDKLRTEWMERIGGCLSGEGQLNGDSFDGLKNWELPLEIEGDAQVLDKLDALKRALRERLDSCVALGNVKTRRQRLLEAERILSSQWTVKALGESETHRMKKIVERAIGMRVGSVMNRCGGEIEVCGEKIGVGETRTVTVRPGATQPQLVSRTGYEPFPLPAEFDGTVFAVDDSMFVAKPIKLVIPRLAAGLRFVLQGREYAGGESLELVPGKYIGRYVRDDRMTTGEKMYKDYLVDFEVVTNGEMQIPGPGNWERTDQYEKYLASPVDVLVPRLESGVRCLIDDSVCAAGMVPVSPLTKHVCAYEKDDWIAQTNYFEVAPGESLSLPGPHAWVAAKDLAKLQSAAKLAERDQWALVDKEIKGVCVTAAENVKELERLNRGVAEWKNAELKKAEAERIAAEKKLAAERKELLRDIEKLLLLEPLKGRRKRLEQAQVLLRGEKAQRVLGQEELERWKDSIDDAMHMVVGRIRNDGDFIIRVGEESIEPGESRVVKYNAALTQGVVVSAKGYEDKKIGKELDEAELSISTQAWIMQDVVVRISGGANGVRRCFKGKEVGAEFTVKPGRYVIKFERDGYEAQNVGFVAELCDGCVVETPREWKVLPIEVRIPELELGVRCYLGVSEVARSVRVLPGQTYAFRYQKDDCEDQIVKVAAERGVTTAIPGPSAWIEVADVKKLVQAEQLAESGEWAKVEQLIAGLKLKAAGNLQRVEKLRLWIKRQKLLDGIIWRAEEAYRNGAGSWDGCVEAYHEAYTNGYRFVPASRDMLETAYNNGMKELKVFYDAEIENAKKGVKQDRSPKKLKEQMDRLMKLYGEMRGK